MIWNVLLLFSIPTGYQATNTTTPATHTTTVRNWHRLDISFLQEAVQRYLGNGIASTTKKNLHYRSTTLCRFLHTSTMSTNTYLWKYPAAICGSPGHATTIPHINQSLSISCAQPSRYQWKPPSFHQTTDSSPSNGPQWHQKRTSCNHVSQG